MTSPSVVRPSEDKWGYDRQTKKGLLRLFFAAVSSFLFRRQGPPVTYVQFVIMLLDALFKDRIYRVDFMPMKAVPCVGWGRKAKAVI